MSSFGDPAVNRVTGGRHTRKVESWQRWRQPRRLCRSQLPSALLLPPHSAGAGQDPAEVKKVLETLRARNQVSRGLLLPEENGDIGPACKQMLGFGRRGAAGASAFRDDVRRHGRAPGTRTSSERSCL